MVGSVINEGTRGLQLAQREMQKSANEIARANVREAPSENTQPEEPSVVPPVDEPRESSQRGIEEPLIELKRQEQLFNANAKVISVANDTLGSLIDVQS